MDFPGQDDSDTGMFGMDSRTLLDMKKVTKLSYSLAQRSRGSSIRFTFTTSRGEPKSNVAIAPRSRECAAELWRSLCSLRLSRTQKEASYDLPCEQNGD